MLREAAGDGALLLACSTPDRASLKKEETAAFQINAFPGRQKGFVTPRVARVISSSTLYVIAIWCALYLITDFGVSMCKAFCFTLRLEWERSYLICVAKQRLTLQ